MSNKFNEFGGGESASVTNGSLDIYGFSLKAENLDANQPLKTNSDKQLVSTQLNISDVVNLQAELDSSIQNPNQSILVTDGVEVTTGNVLKTDTIEPTSAQDVILTTTNPYRFKTDRIEVGEMWTNFLNIVFRSPVNLSGNSISAVSNISVSEIYPTITPDISIKSADLNLDNNNITNGGTITTTTINSTNTGETLMTGDLDLGENNIERVIQADISLIEPYGGTNVNFGGNINMANATDKDIKNVGTTTTANIKTDVIASVLGGINDDILVNNDFAMNNAGITNVQQIAMVGDIRMNNNDILTGGTINTDNVNATNVDTTTLGAGNVNITSNTISSSSVLEFKSGGSDRVNFKSDNGILSLENGNLGGNVELEFAQFGFETFSINKDSSKVNICQSGLNNIELTTDCFVTNKKVIFDPTTSTTQFRDYDVDMNNNNISDVNNLEVKSVNNLTSVGGIYSGISDGVTISSSTFTDLLPISSVGGLSVPANTFLLGSAFHLVCAGIFPSENKNDNVEIELCAIQGATTIQLGLVNLELENFDTLPSNFELEADYVIRKLTDPINPLILGEVAVSFDFTFNKRVSRDFKGTRATNLATIDTTQNSTLALNARIIGTNGSSIKSTLAYLRKQY